jgi:hypothetical protein
MSDEIFPLPPLMIPLCTDERVLMLKRRLERYPEAERSMHLALIEQRVKQERRIDLIKGVKEYRRRLRDEDWYFPPRKLHTASELADGLAIDLWKKPDEDRHWLLSMWEDDFKKAGRNDLLEAAAILRASVAFLREMKTVWPSVRAGELE